MNLSKKLKNALIIEGAKKELINYISELGKKSKIVSVQYPKGYGKISTEFINKKWKIKNVNDIILYAKPNANRIVLSFSNEDFEEILLNLVKEFKLNATYIYVIEENGETIIESEEYIDGSIHYDEDEEFVEENGQIILKIIDEVKKIKTNKYSFAQCFN